MAYAQFSKDFNLKNAETLKECSFKERSGKVAEAWKLLADDEKDKYKQLAADAKAAKPAKDMKALKGALKSTKYTKDSGKFLNKVDRRVLRSVIKAEKSLPEKFKAKPKKDLSAYMLFGANMRATSDEVKKAPFKEQMGIVSAAWNKLSEEGKKCEKLVTAHKKEQEQKLAAWNASSEKPQFEKEEMACKTLKALLITANAQNEKNGVSAGKAVCLVETNAEATQAAEVLEIDVTGAGDENMDGNGESSAMPSADPSTERGDAALAGA